MHSSAVSACPRPDLARHIGVLEADCTNAMVAIRRLTAMQPLRSAYLAQLSIFQSIDRAAVNDQAVLPQPCATFVLQ